MKNKIFDCITFFKENFITNIRFEILKNVVDYFVICESKYDHNGNKKELNFQLRNSAIKNKIKYIVLEDPFPIYCKNNWERQAFQRDYMLNSIKNIRDNDYIFFSDPDEIPNPKILRKFNLKKKYGIFLQNHFVYKFNLFNSYDTPWAGTRVCQFGNLYSIDYLRQKILVKNLKKWWRPDKEKNIELFYDAGWHFKDMFNLKDLSLKLKTFAHQEYNKKQFFNLERLKKKLKEKKDIYNKGHIYTKVTSDDLLPEYIVKNKKKFKKYFA